MRGQNALNTETVLKIYYDYPYEIGNKQIKELFDVSSDATCIKIKNEIRNIVKNNKPELKVWNKCNVNTMAALQYTNINIEQLEENYIKRKRIFILENFQIDRILIIEILCNQNLL